MWNALHALDDVISGDVTHIDVSHRDLAGFQEVQEGLHTSQSGGNHADPLFRQFGLILDFIEFAEQIFSIFV